MAVGVGEGLLVAVGTGVSVGGWDGLQTVAISVTTGLTAEGDATETGDSFVGEISGVWFNGAEQPTRINNVNNRNGILGKSDPTGFTDSQDRKSMVITFLAVVLLFSRVFM